MRVLWRGLSEVQELLWRDVAEGVNKFNVCDLQINIKHVMLLQLDKMILMVDNDSVV